MTVNELNKILENKILILDGATGTELQKRGMPNGVCPEEWVVENPDVLKEIQTKYKEACSNVVYTCTYVSLCIFHQQVHICMHVMMYCRGTTHS